MGVTLAPSGYTWVVGKVLAFLGERWVLVIIMPLKNNKLSNQSKIILPRLRKILTRKIISVFISHNLNTKP